MLSKTDIMNQLQAFACARGSVVSVHASLKAIGEIVGGGETLLSALIEFFTADGGLLCVSTHTWDSFVYDRREKWSCLGVLACLSAAHPDAVRSLHPSHSVAVFGEPERAKAFVQGDATVKTQVSPDGSYGKLYDEDGYVLLLGVGQEKNTFLHCVEEMLQVPNRLMKEPTEWTVIHKDGREETRLLYCLDEENHPDVSLFFGKFEPAFRYHGCITDGKIGNAPVQLCRARKMKEVIELIYRRSGGEELLGDDAPLAIALYQ